MKEFFADLFDGAGAVKAGRWLIAIALFAIGQVVLAIIWLVLSGLCLKKGGC